MLIIYSLYPSINLFIHSFSYSFLHPSTHLFIHLIIHHSHLYTINPSTHAFIHLSNHLSIHPPFNSSFYSFILPFTPCIHPSIHSSWSHPSIHSFIHPSIHPSIHSFIHLLIHSSIPSFIHPISHSNCKPILFSTLTSVINTRIEYYVIGSSPASGLDLFKVDKNSGLVLTNTFLEESSRGCYELMFEARNPDSLLKDNASGIICITDQNESPAFDQSFYDFNIDENEPAGK